MNTVELFCGTKSFSKVAKDLGYNTFTVDIEPKNNPDFVCDILDFNISSIPFDKVDVLWMSPPCTTFSVASLRHYWIDGKPKNEKTLHGIKLVAKALEIKDELLRINPDMKWYMENPRGMLRKQAVVNGLFKNTITYCKYGSNVQKATDIWTNDLSWKPIPMCKAGDPCHVRAPRGSNTGTQGIKYKGSHPDWAYNINRDALSRGVIPPKLFYEIFGVMQ